MEEKSMKKIFIALSVLAALTLGVGSALAAPGVPDLVPGTDFVVPFLVSKASVDTGAGPTTYLDLTEVRGLETRFNIVFYTTKSVISGSDHIPITPWGTVMVNVAKYLADMSDTNLALLAVTFNGEPYYAGYIKAENYVSAPLLDLFGWARGMYDNVIGSFYFLDLAGGKAGASNLPMREFYNQASIDQMNPLTVAPTNAANPFYLLTWAFTQATPKLTTKTTYPDFGNKVSNPYYERWSGVALANAEMMLSVGTPLTKMYGNPADAGDYTKYWRAPTAAWLVLYPEYYILDETGETTFVLYQSGLPNGSSFHMYVINAAEDYQNTTIKIDEVTFIDAESNVPNGLKVAYPYQGIFNWTSSNDLNGPAEDDILWAEFLGWSWQKADNGATSAATNWTIMKQMAREVGTRLVGPFNDAPEPFVDLSELVNDILDLL